MNLTSNQPYFPARYWWLIALCGLTAMAWHGLLDEYSAQDISASIANAGIIYGTARGINALVSLLQGTELNIVLVTVSIGEVLDPVNDLIERFSEVILVSLAALALQKIVLAVVSHTMFNILLLIVAAATSICLFKGSPRLVSTMLRTFMVVAFFRFSLGLVVIANSWVDATFLDEADQARHVAMEKFQGELRQIDTLSRQEDEASVLLSNAQDELSQLQEKRSANERRISEIDEKLQLQELRLADLRSQADRLCKISARSPTCPAAVKNAVIGRDTLASQRKEALASQTAIDEASSDLQEQIVCFEKRQQGKDCSFWDSLPSAPDSALLRQKLNEINANLSDFAENCINLLVSLLLKTVAIPLLFFYLLLKITQINWSRL